MPSLTSESVVLVVRNLLLHNAGFRPDPSPQFWSPEFGCNQSSTYYPKETFDCQAQILNGVLNQDLIYPTGSRYLYSDLSMITMMYVVGTLARRLNYVTGGDLRTDCAAGLFSGEVLDRDEVHPIDQCYYEAYVRKYVVAAAEMEGKSRSTHCAYVDNSCIFMA